MLEAYILLWRPFPCFLKHVEHGFGGGYPSSPCIALPKCERLCLQMTFANQTLTLTLTFMDKQCPPPPHHHPYGLSPCSPKATKTFSSDAQCKDSPFDLQKQRMCKRKCQWVLTNM